MRENPIITEIHIYADELGRRLEQVGPTQYVARVPHVERAGGQAAQTILMVEIDAETVDLAFAVLDEAIKAAREGAHAEFLSQLTRKRILVPGVNGQLPPGGNGRG